MAHLLTDYGVAMLLGIRVGRVRRLVDGREIPFIRLPTGDVRFQERDVLAWARGYRQPLVEHVEKAAPTA